MTLLPVIFKSITNTFSKLLNKNVKTPPTGGSQKGWMPASGYNQSSFEFLMELIPESSLDMFENLKTVSSPMLNMLFHCGLEIYGQLRFKKGKLASFMISIYNFYLTTQESTSWTRLSIGFLDMINSIFSFDLLPKLYKIISETVMTYFQSIRKYFLKAESVEKTTASFWKMIDLQDNRSFLNIFWELTSVMSTCTYIYEFGKSNLSFASLSAVVDTINTHLLDPHSEIRVRVHSATDCIARIIDFFILNFEHLTRGDFSKVTWSLPCVLQFENEYSSFMAIYRHYVENPSTLEEKNMTLVNLRDQSAILIKKAHTEISKSSQGALRGAMTRYLHDLDSACSRLTDALNPNNMKPQPMSVVLVGPAGCGKSTISGTISKIMQTIANRSPNEDLIKNKGGDPKFEPAIDSKTEVILLDDFGNDTSARIPAKEILDSINVTKEIIPKASVEEKNRHKYSNIGCVITTNDDNIGINQISTINYGSILRRFGIVVFLRVKPEYCIPNTDVLNRSHEAFSNGKHSEEIYEIELKLPIRATNEDSKIDYIIYETIEDWRKEGMTELKSCIVFLKQFLKKEWETNVLQHENRNNVGTICPLCKLETLGCTCQEEKLLPEAESRFSQVATSLLWFSEGLTASQEFCTTQYSIMDESAMSFVESANLRLYGLLLSKDIIAKIFYIMSDFVTYWKFYMAMYFCCLPMMFVWSYELMACLFYVLYFAFNNPFSNFHYGIFVGVYSIIHLFIRTEFFALALFCPSIWYLFYLLCEYITARNIAREKMLARNDLIRSHYYSRMVCYGAICGSGIFALLLFAKTILPFVFAKKKEACRDPVQAPYLPTFASSNVSSKINSYFVPKPSEAAITSSLSEGRSFVGSRLLIVRVTNKAGFDRTFQGIPDGSEVIVPAHGIPHEGLFDVEICADYSKRTSVYRSKDVPQSAYVQLKDLSGVLVDCALLCIPNIPTQPSLLRYFAVGRIPKADSAIQMIKNMDGTVTTVDVRITTPNMLQTASYPTERGRFSSYPRYKVQAQNFESYPGMCGSPIIVESANCIVGMHVCGTETNEWYALKLTSSMITDARSTLVAESERFISHPIPPTFSVKSNLLGLKFDPVSPTLAVHAINELLSPIEEIGVMTRDGELYVDRAEKHYFPNSNPKLESAFGPRTTRPPTEPNGGAQISSTLIKLHAPKFDVPIDLIDRAGRDYLDGDLDGINFDDIIKSLKDANSEFFSVRPLEEALKGDRTQVIRGINNNSSAGCLYGGKKPRHYDMTVPGDPLEERVLLPYMKKDLENQELDWRQGRGTFDIFKRCSKTNELLGWEKAAIKTRSFYSNDMVFFLNMVRGTIPLKHVLRKNKHLSECFIGVVSQSKDWGDLKNFLSKDGEYSNFVCGDFSGYDTQLPKALLDKAAWILVEMARRGGMKESDLQFLRGALSSVVSPTLLWQGHVIRMANGQPSGQPLTTEINSIVNSLLMRMVFYTIMDENYPNIKFPQLRDYVRLATYGDDNVLGVSDKIPLYNHTNIQSVFLRWGIKYTMADKEADSIPYQTIDEVSFLKRSFREHPDLGLVAPIELDSIQKCFYYWVRPKNTPLTFPQQFSACASSQAREACLHGRAYYEQFCFSIATLQEGSLEMKEEFRIKWNGFQLLSYDEMVEELSHSYE